MSSFDLVYFLDHLLVGAAYFVDQAIDTFDALTRDDPVETKSKTLSPENKCLSIII